MESQETPVRNRSIPAAHDYEKHHSHPGRSQALSAYKEHPETCEQELIRLRPFVLIQPLDVFTKLERGMEEGN